MNNFNTDILQKASDSRYVLGLSGGVDSMALLHLLLEADIAFTAVYVHHGLRDEADEEAEFLADYCANVGVDFEALKIDIQEYLKKNKESVEEAARNLRYAALFGLAEKEGFDGVVVAHHFDDQAESILMHVLRGSGLDGLSGMAAWLCPSPFHDRIPLLRPLLDVPKKDLIAFCAEREIPVHEDETNQDNNFRRNLIRNEILPVMEKFNPQVKSKLVQLGKIAKDEADFMEEQVDLVWKSVCDFYDYEKRFVEIKRAHFTTLAPAMQKRVLRKAVKLIRPENKNVGYVTISAMMAELEKDYQTNILYFEDHLLLVFMYDVCFLCDVADALAQKYFPQVDEEMTVVLESAEVWVSPYDKLLVDVVDYDAFLNRDVNDLMCAFFDGDVFKEIEITHKRSGDRMQMLGFGGQSKKIATVLIDIKVHREARAKYPIFRDSEGKVLWVPGYKISIDHPVQKTSKKVIKLKLCKQ